MSSDFAPFPTTRRLPLREWLALGQALVDKSNAGPRWFRKLSTQTIVIGLGVKVVADGKRYGAGTYALMS